MDEEFYYVTKWALTSGVLMIPCDKARVSGNRRLLCWGKWNWVHDNDWHETRASADARVAEMKERRRASLLKSLEQLDRPVKYQEYADV